MNCKDYEYITVNSLSDDEQKELADVMADDDEPDSFDRYYNWIKEEFLKLKEDRKRYIFAKYKSCIIGFIRIWNSEYCNKYYNDGIVVKNDFKNRGIGYKLLIEGIHEALKMGCKELYANINKKNISSIKIHEKCGFINIGRTEKNSYGSSDVSENSYEYRLCIKNFIENRIKSEGTQHITNG